MVNYKIYDTIKEKTRRSSAAMASLCDNTINKVSQFIILNSTHIILKEVVVKM